MLEVVVEVDGRPLSRWGCDGVVLRDADRLDRLQLLRRRTGRVAGGRGAAAGADQRARPVRPAAGRRARPRCSRSRSSARTDGAGVLWCDGRRTVDLPPGARIEVRRGERPVRLVRLHRGAVHRPAGAPSSACRSQGWRGAAERRRRRRGVHGGRPDARGDPDRPARRHRVLDARARPGPDRHHRRDRRRQDDGRHRARPAARRPGRQRRGPHRRRDRPGRGRGRTRPASTGSPAAVDDAGGEVEDDRVVLARNVSAEGRSRAFVGGASVPGRPGWPRSPSRWSPCTASPTSTGCCSRGPSARRSTGSAATPLAALLAAYTDAARAASRPTERELDEVVATRPRAGPGGRPAPLRARRDRGGRPRAGRGRRSWRPRRPGWASPTPCAPPPSRRREALSSEDGRPRRARRPPPRPARCSRGSASTTPRRASWPTGSPRSPTCSPTWPPTSRPTPPASTPTRPGWPRVSERRAALTALTRKYGDTDRRGARLGRGLGGPAARPRRHRRADRGAAGRAGGAARRAGRARRRTLSAAAAGRRRGSAEVTAELAPLAMPTPGSVAVPARRRPSSTTADGAARSARGGSRLPRRRRRGRAPAGRQHRLRAAAAAQGRLRR